MKAVKAAEPLQNLYRTSAAADSAVESMEQSLVNHLEVREGTPILPCHKLKELHGGL
jgi:hypothetical protein